MSLQAKKIPRHITNRLLHLAQSAPDQEICGLIAGKSEIATDCYPIDNTSAQPEKRFSLDAKQQIEAMAEMRNKGQQLFAIYHSHPSAPAVPSSLDIEQAAYPNALYLVISLNTKGVLEIRGYEIKNKKAVEVPISL